jgi:hypothetical protein
MGLGYSQEGHEGCGRTYRDAVLALDAALRYYYFSTVTVKQQKLDGGQLRYFVWSGLREIPIHYRRSGDFIKAYILHRFVVV